MTERWLSVVGFEGLYEVSDYGRVRSLDRPVRNGYPGTTRVVRGKMMKPTVALRGGYHYIGLAQFGKIRTLKVHRLVLEAFVGPGHGLHGRHLDGNPKNNALSNLAWGTHQQNGQDMVRHGRSQRGEKSPLARMTEEKVRQSRRMYASGISQESIADTFGVAQGTISAALRGVSWSWVDEPIPKMRPVGQGPGPRPDRRGPRRKLAHPLAEEPSDDAR